MLQSFTQDSFILHLFTRLQSRPVIWHLIIKTGYLFVVLSAKSPVLFKNYTISFDLDGTYAF